MAKQKPPTKRTFMETIDMLLELICRKACRLSGTDFNRHGEVVISWYGGKYEMNVRVELDEGDEPTISDDRKYLTAIAAMTCFLHALMHSDAGQSLIPTSLKK